jgi:hypothetical protein
MRIIIALCTFLSVSFFTLAQEVVTPLHSNRVIKAYLKEVKSLPVFPHAVLGAEDTLSLPFTDDFSGTRVYPDTNKWSDRAVYVNNSFAVNPPSYNVATFDALNRFGDAYNNTGFDPYGFADTLTSKPINLSVSNPADSLYLSFYIQAQGIGLDSLARRDSLVLEFYNQFGVWVRVWQTGGRRPAPFEYVLIPLVNPNYFHAGFRFRWMNRVGLSGNLNHWHLDYVRLDRFRSAFDTTYKDIAINNPFRPLLRTYCSMPWKQFKNSPQNEEADSLYIRARNLDNLLTQVVHQYKAYDKDGNIIAQDSNRLNIPANDTALYRLRKIGIPTSLSEDSFYRITTVYRVFSTFDLNRKNDSLLHRQEFSNYFAYDDGTAESGYGIIGGAGKVALKYKLNKPDTLRAIRIYFNQAETDVRNKPFTLALWSEIGTNEKLRYFQPLNGPVYTDEVNGFATLILDTPQFLDGLSYPGGVFYIGWIQTADFILNVGLDVNYATMLGAAAAINPNLSFFVGSSWQPSLIKGAPMMRPVLGGQVDDPLSVRQKPVTIRENQLVQVYPNPASEQVTLTLKQPQPVDVTVYSVTGVVMYHDAAEDSLRIPVNGWSRGLYFAVVKNRQTGTVNTVKFLKQ